MCKYFTLIRMEWLLFGMNPQIAEAEGNSLVVVRVCPRMYRMIWRRYGNQLSIDYFSLESLHSAHSLFGERCERACEIKRRLPSDLHLTSQYPPIALAYTRWQSRCEDELERAKKMDEIRIGIRLSGWRNRLFIPRTLSHVKVAREYAE